MPPRRALAPRLTVVLTCALLVGCAHSVEIAAPSPQPADLAPCAAFTAALPSALSTVGERRDVTPESPLTAAYGDPPVGIRCGVPTPESLGPTSTLVTVDDIQWFPEELSAGWLMTSIGRAANVELTVPTEQGPAPSVAADLAPTIAATLPATE